MVGWAVYGGLVLVGFFFGIVTGYDQPKTVVVAKAPKEKEPPKPPDKPAPKVTPEPQPAPEPQPTPPVVVPKDDPPPKKDPPKVDPPKIDTPPPKKEDPKTEVVTAVSFKEVTVVLRKHCTECHGAGKVQGKVDLTSIAKMKASKGQVLVPGKPDQSDLYTSITVGEMPKDRKKPTDQELMVIRNWILGGAKERRRIRGCRFARQQARPGPR
jgi:hypothetical protein